MANRSSSRKGRDTTPRHLPPQATITALTSLGTLPALARERTLPRPSDPWRPWFWLAAFLLHALVIALFLVTFQQRETMEDQSPPGMQVVFDNSGAQPQSPPPQVNAPPAPATAPPPAAPPPPQADQPEVNLNMPDMKLSEMPAPTPQPQPQRQAQRRPAQPSHTSQHYVVMNDMSFGKPSPPVPFAHRAMNLDLSADDQQAAAGPELVVKGDAGANWGAALDKWVEAHKYYPDAALQQDQQGSVEIEFVVNRAGDVLGVKMLNGSGSPFLDQAWSGLFDGAQLPPFPSDAKSDTVTVDATMHYILLH